MPIVSPSKTRGRREGRMPGRHPWPACKEKSTRRSPQVRPGNTRPSLRDGFNAYTRSPRGPAVLPPSPRAMREHQHETWRQPRGARTTRFRRPSQAARPRQHTPAHGPPRPPRSHPTQLDDPEAPLGWIGINAEYADLPKLASPFVLATVQWPTTISGASAGSSRPLPPTRWQMVWTLDPAGYVVTAKDDPANLREGRS